MDPPGVAWMVDVRPGYGCSSEVSKTQLQKGGQSVATSLQLSFKLFRLT